MAKTRNRLIAVGIALLLFIAAAVLIIPTTTASAASFSGGDGTPSNPYMISTAADLAAIAQQVNSSGTEHYKDVYFKLSNNIDLGGKEWTPIGKNDSTYWFEGNFDGNGKTISNLTITQKTDGGFLGLFGCSRGTIKNLFIKDVNITGSGQGRACAICAANYGTIEKCGVDSGKIVDNTSEYKIGGVCGVNFGTISQCYNKADLTANNGRVAGISGMNYQGTIKNCYNAGTITQTGTNASGYLAGGICSDNSSSTIENCLNFGKVTSAGGKSYGSGKRGTVNHFYYDIDVCGSLEGTGSGKTTAELCSGSLPYSTFDSSIWETGSSSEVQKGRIKTVKYTYPKLVMGGDGVSKNAYQYDFSTEKTSGFSNFEDATPIYTAEDFKAIKDNLSGNYVLMNDIDFNGAEIEPIGDKTTPFKGKFSGNGHTIRNFKINTSEKYVGLFGVNNGTIMNLAVEGGNVTGGSDVGGICGENYGTIYCCSFDGTVSGNNFVGGICGMNDKTISNCFNSGKITGAGNTGGICGRHYAGSIEYCISVGTIERTGSNSYYGGVAGSKTSPSLSTIGYCYYDYEVCKVPNDYAVGETPNAPGTTHVNSAITSALCGDTNPYSNFNRDIWEKGSNGSDVTVENDRFGKQKYTYIHLKGIGTAKTRDVSVYNFNVNGSDDWETYAPISTAEEFQKITDRSQNYVLMNDIDFGGKTITPIGKGYAFDGSFSGDGHTLSNFTISSAGDNVGLFEKISDRVQIMNLGVVGAKVSGGSNVGAICGQSKGTIVNCYVFADVTATGSNAGGICGDNTDSMVKNC